MLLRYDKKRHGSKSEKRISRKLKAKIIPGSGSLPGRKGDSELPEFLIESKCTVKDSIGLKHEWLEKIKREALEKNKYPALTLSFVHGDGREKGADWICIPLWLAERLGLMNGDF